MKSPKNVIIRMPNWIGDFVMSLAAVADLREAFPDLEITLMCQKPLEALVREDPRVNEVLVFSKKSLAFSRRESRVNVANTLAQGKYDVGILFTNSFSSAWYFWQGNIPRRIGYRGHFRSFLLTDKNVQKKELHQVDLYREVLKPLGVKPTKTTPKLFVDDQEKKRVEDLLKREGKTSKQYLILINCLAAYGQAKCWPKEKFRALAKKLLEDQGVFLVFIGDEKGKKEIDGIVKGFGVRALNLAGKTSLSSLVALLALSDLVITNDSGPMHIAAALQKELIAIFGSTNEKKTGPYQAGVVVRKEVSCAPCYKRVCPIDFRCMEKISVEEIYDLIKEKKQKHVQNTKKSPSSQSL